MSELGQHDVVRVSALPANVHATYVIAPGIGDRGTVVDVLRERRLADRLLVESCDSRGRTLWVADFPRDALVAAPVAPCESLAFETMASGHAALNLGRDVPWNVFPDYALAVARRLGAAIVDAADGPGQRQYTLDIDGRRYWLVRDDYSSYVSLEPHDARAHERMQALRARLRETRGAADAVFRLRGEPGALPRIDTGVHELDFFLREELGTGGSVDEDSLTLELASQLADMRLGRAQRIANGSDAIFVTITPASVCLEYAAPKAPRPGVLVTLHSFADVFAAWFEEANPALGAKIREIVWPRAIG
jgi:hypothetical protein